MVIDTTYGDRSYFSFPFIMYQTVYGTFIKKKPSNQSYSSCCSQLKLSLFQLHSLVVLKIFKSISFKNLLNEG